MDPFSAKDITGRVGQTWIVSLDEEYMGILCTGFIVFCEHDRFQMKKNRNYIARVPESDHTIGIHLPHQMDYYMILFFIGVWY